MSERDSPTTALDYIERYRFAILAWAILVAVIIVGRLTPFEPVSDFFHSLSWFTKKVLNIAEEAFDRYGYLTVFLAPMMENTLFLGALIPGTLIMLLAGLSAHDGIISFWPALALAILGTIIGDTISYGIGRFSRTRLGPDSQIGRWAEEMREPLFNHSILLVLSYHFAGYSRLVGPAAAGFLRMPMTRWMLLDYVGASIWATTFITAGYFLGVAGLSLEDSDRNVQIFEVLLFGFFFVSIFLILRKARSSVREHKERTATDDGPAATTHGEPEAVAERSDR